MRVGTLVVLGAVACLAACSSTSTNEGGGGSATGGGGSATGGTAGTGGSPTGGAGGTPGGGSGGVAGSAGGTAGASGFCGQYGTQIGAACVLHTFTDELAGLIAVDATHVYWTSDKTVRRIDINATTESVLVTQPTTNSPRGITIFNGHVCWAERDLANINAGFVACRPVDLTGNVLKAQNEYSPHYLDHDGSNLFWSGNGALAKIRRADPALAAATAADAPNGTAIAVDPASGGKVYWASDDGIYGVDKLGTAQLGGKLMNAETALWPSSRRMVFATANSKLYFNLTSGVGSLTTGGVAALNVVTESDEVGGVAVDASRLYWGTRSATSALRYQLLSGGTSTTITPDAQGVVNSIAVDADNVYWVSAKVVAKIKRN